jgi:hypothetical protein
MRAASLRWLLAVMNAAPTAFGQHPPHACKKVMFICTAYADKVYRLLQFHEI